MLVLRVAGNRTLAKLNVFDLVVTIALGSILAAALVTRGRVRREALRRERVTMGEVRAALRREGHGSMADVAAVVLETDGSISVVPRAGGGREQPR